MAVVIGAAIFTIGVSTVALYMAITVWLNRHGGIRRWQLWIMLALAGAIIMGAIGLSVQPVDWQLIGFLAGLGALAGAISGLFTRRRPPARSQHHTRISKPPHH